MRMVVVLPEPLGPRKPKMVPRLTCIDRSRTTFRPPNDLVRPCTSMTISGAAPDAVADVLAGAALIATLAAAPQASSATAAGASRRPAGRRGTRRVFPAAPR